MWNQISVPFAKLLGSKLYPTLFGNTDYQEFLAICGITKPYPDDVWQLTAEQRARLAEYATLRSNLLALDLQGLEALKQATAKPVEISGPHPIYRLYNSQVSGSELRFFWFGEELLLQSYKEAGGSKSDRLEWLRGQCAVAYNWSACDRLARLRLRKQDTLLAIQADGLPIRGVQIRKGDTSVRLPGDYFSNFPKYSAMLPGGSPQLFLYLLPKDGVEQFW